MTKIVRSGLEVYKTKDSNKEEITKKEDSEGFVFQNGTATEISYYADMYENSFEYDYEDISSNAQVSFPNVDSSKFYKGKRVCLKKAYNPKKWGDLKNCLTGFITEQTYSMDKVELKISGMAKLLEKKYEFNFTKTKRSIVVKKIIETAGLKANVNVKGLKDDVIDYTNVSSSSSTGSSGDADIDAKVKEIIGNETDELKKAKLIHQWLSTHNKYKGYECSQKSTPGECLKSLKNNCADTSRLTCAMFKSAGLNATIIHGAYHFWTVVTIKGKEYASDATHNGRPFNKVWKGLSTGKKCGDTPDC